MAAPRSAIRRNRGVSGNLFSILPDERAPALSLYTNYAEAHYRCLLWTWGTLPGFQGGVRQAFGQYPVR